MFSFINLPKVFVQLSTKFDLVTAHRLIKTTTKIHEKKAAKLLTKKNKSE